jgi:hypothetical protein
MVLCPILASRLLRRGRIRAGQNVETVPYARGQSTAPSSHSTALDLVGNRWNLLIVRA